MADSCVMRLKCEENKKNRSTCDSSVNLREKVLCKSELKSSIPKPTPCVRKARASVRTRSSLSFQSQPSCHQTKIPQPVWASERGRTSTSLTLGRGAAGRTAKSQSPAPLPKPQPPRPKSACVARNPYPHVQAKVNSKLKNGPKLKSNLNPLNVRLVATPDSTITECSRDESLDMEPSAKEDARLNNQEFLLKQRQLVKLYNELKNLQVPQELQPLEVEICKLIQSKNMEMSQGRHNTLLLSEGSPEFLSTFESQMQEVTEGWLRLICDLVSTRLSVSNSAFSRLSLPDPTLNLRDEVLRFLISLPSDGEALNTKLQRIEKEQLKVMTLVAHSALALFKEHEELKDRYFRLEKTQDQIHFELKEQLAILGEENEELDRKYEKSVEKYNIERAKVEHQEKYKTAIHKEMVDMKRFMKLFDGKFNEWDTKSKKIDTQCRNLEVAMKHKGSAYDKEKQNHRETLNKFKDAKETIEKLKSELAGNDEKLLSVEKANKELKDELVNKKNEIIDLEKHRKEMLDDITLKTKRILEFEEKMNSVEAYNNSNVIRDALDTSTKIPFENLLRENHQKDLLIQELKKEINKIEHVLKDKSAKEDNLMIQVAELQKKPHENEVVLRNQIKELQYELKDMGEEKVELERMIAQKTLELDQRDLLMREHAQVLRARDELLPMVQSKQRRHKDYVEKLSAIIVEQQKTYFNQDVDEYSNNEEPNIQRMMKELDRKYSIDPNLVDQELAFRHEKMAELFNLLEHKQMEMMRMERRIRTLQGARNEKDKLEKEKEARISILQRELEDRKSGKSRGIFSLFTGQDGSS